MFLLSKLNKKYLNLLLAVFLFVTGVGIFNNVQAEEESTGLTWEVVENDKEHLDTILPTVDEHDSGNNATRGNKRASIILEEDSAMDRYPGLEPDDERVISYREYLKNRQDELTKKIEEEILYGDLDVVWNITLTGNIISVNVPNWVIEPIKELDGVKDVVLENRYAIEDYEVDAEEPNMSNASKMTNIQTLWSSGYTGAGSIVAIIDTGIDMDHISFDDKAFEYAIEEVRKSGKEVDLLTEEEVREKWSSLHAAERSEVSYEDADVYGNSKVPFKYNYVDNNFDVSHINDEQGYHGSHVAGIAAANRYIRTQEGKYKNALEYVKTQGDAPDAQILVMKVFGVNGGAYDSDYFVAIEDAITLGADAVNLSLGSKSAGTTYRTDAFQNTAENLKRTNIIWTGSAGNSSYWASETDQGNLYKEDVNYATGGTPNTHSTSLSTASVDNDGTTSRYMLFKDRIMFYSETAENNDMLITLSGEHEFIYIDNIGEKEQFEEVKDVLQGKIAICNRGVLTFAEKMTNAVENGAIATIIANNVDGVMSMGIKGYKYKNPAVMISLQDANYIKDNSTLVDNSYYTGKITIFDNMASEYYDSSFYKMSNFSSFGVPSDLTMKPEITAPGGNIYSVAGLALGSNDSGNDKYANLSGTSMAAPQIAGLTAVLTQYMRENDLDKEADRLGLTKRAMMQSLFMSTAVPLIEESSGSYFSILNQGAGLVNIEGAVNSNIVILMDGVKTNGAKTRDISEYATDGKVKAELGDDPLRTGKYSVSFTLNNITDNDLYYDLDASFFTQDIIDNYLVTSTAPLHPDLKWNVDGITYPLESNLDFNNDNILNDPDAQVILDYVAGNIEEFRNMEYADLDSDGKITSYDAHLLLTIAKNGAVEVPAKGRVLVTLNIDLGDEIEEYNYNGAYVEGYIFAKERDSDEGVLGVTHSIPVLGYYGGFDEPSMIDYETYISDRYKQTKTTPYFKSDTKQSFTYAEPKNSGSLYYFGGNPFGAKFDEYKYYPERNALNSNNSFSGIIFTPIRNVASWRVVIYDKNNQAVYENINDQEFAAFYIQDHGWQNVSLFKSIDDSDPAFIEGERYRITLQMALDIQRDKQGNIDWNDVREVWNIPFIIDNTAPAVSSVTDTTNEKGETILHISVSDNNYIAALKLCDENMKDLYDILSTNETKTEGDAEEYEINLGTNAPEHMYFEVSDYASNVTTVKINLNKEELTQDPRVEIGSDYEKQSLYSSIKLSAKLLPYSLDDTLVWRSADETIATVDQNGVVEGVKEGRTLIYARSQKYNVEDSCTVEFFTIDKELSALIKNENTHSIGSFNTKSLPAYTSTVAVNEPLNCATYAADGKLYMMSSQESSSSLYEKTENGSTPIIENLEIGGIKDITASPYFGNSALLAVSNKNIYLINASEKTVGGPFALQTENNMIGITYVRTDSNGEHVLLLDDKGAIYEAVLSMTDNKYAVSMEEIMDADFNFGSTGPYSLYYDGRDLFWSAYVDSCTFILCVKNILNVNLRDGYYILGQFEENVEVSGLHSTGQLNLFPRQEEALSQYETESTALIRNNENTQLVINNNAVSLNFYNSHSELLTNGKYEIRYDASALKFEGITSDIKYKAENDNDEGRIVFTFAEKGGETSGSKVFVVNFTRLNDNDSNVVIYERERGKYVSASGSYEYRIPSKGQGPQEIDPENSDNDNNGYRVPVTGIEH